MSIDLMRWDRQFAAVEKAGGKNTFAWSAVVSVFRSMSVASVEFEIKLLVRLSNP
jgi:hypothetical protein